MSKRKLDLFSRYLTLWVALCMIVGSVIGALFPGFASMLSGLEIFNVSIPVAIVLFAMMYPIMLNIDFKEILDARKNAKPILFTSTVNWLIKPFLMAFISWLFMSVLFSGIIPLSLQQEYIAGMILLGLAPCTAMVLVWTMLAKGNVNYALVQISIDDLVLILIYAPLGKFLLGVTTDFPVPFMTILSSVLFYVALPLILAMASRSIIIREKGEKWLKEDFIKHLEGVMHLGLLLTLVLIFIFQGSKIFTYPLHIILIAIPLMLQTYIIFGIGYFGTKKLGIAYREAAPASFIGASNFFELAVAVSLILFGAESGATLATVVGVLVEVPVMLSLVHIMKQKRHSFVGG